MVVRSLLPNYALLESVSKSAGFLRVFHNPVAHCSVVALPFVPHPQQSRVACIHEIDDAHVGLGGEFTVEAAGILLRGSLPRDQHRQYQGVEDGVVKPLARADPYGK